MIKKTKLSRLLLVACAGLLTAGLTRPAYAAAVDITIRLRSLTTTQPVEGEVSVETGQEAANLSERGPGLYRFKGNLGVEAVDTFEIVITAPNPFVSRTVPARGDRFEKIVSRAFTLFLAKIGSYETYDYLDAGLSYFKQARYDGALAYYEAAFYWAVEKRGLRRETQYTIKLRYNYTRALFLTCSDPKLEYNTCQAAAEALFELTGLYDKHKRLFELERISKDELDSARQKALAKEKQVKYRKIAQLFEQQRFLEAARLAEEALEDLKTDSKVMALVGLEQDGLLRDAGVSYLRAADQARARRAPVEVIRDFLRRAQRYLAQLEKPDRKDRRNLELIEIRLRR